MKSIPEQHSVENSGPETENVGWKWRDLSWRGRLVLVVSVVVGTAFVLGIVIVMTEMDEGSPLRRGLVALLLLPFGIAGVVARKQKSNAAKARE